MANNYRKLKVFLCYTSHDKPTVREIYKKLNSESWIDPWLDEEKLIPGVHWGMQIEQAVESTDAVIIFLSNHSVTKEGYVQKEIKVALDYSQYKPEGTIFIIPLRIDSCSIPWGIKSIQYIDYFPSDEVDIAYKKLLYSLETRASLLGLDIAKIREYFQKEEEEKAKIELLARINEEAREKARREEEMILRQEAEQRARIEIKEEIRKLIEEGKRKEAEKKSKQEKELIQKKANELYMQEIDLLKQKRMEDEEGEEDWESEFPQTSYQEPSRNNTNLIIGIVTVLLICCCCATTYVFWFYGDQIIAATGG